MEKMFAEQLRRLRTDYIDYYLMHILTDVATWDKLKDMGIMASLDPVALDKACLDMVFNHKSTEGDDAKPLIERINRQHGTHIVDYAEKIGLGSTAYVVVDIDNK